MIEVFANGQKFSYWTSARISRSLDHIAAGFSLNIVAKDPLGNLVKLFPGDSVEIAVDGVTVVKGYVEKFSTSFSPGSHSFSVSGSEISCDIADCCVENPMEWQNRNLEQIISDICGRFGLFFQNVMGVDVGKVLVKFSVDPGVKALETMSKLCKERGVIPCSNGLGQIYLLDPAKCPRGPELKQGVNLTSASVDFSINDRYSAYYVYGSGKAKSKVKSVKNDSDVGRYRPLLVVDSNATQKESVEARADWEYSIRKAKSMGFRCSVRGWSHEGGIWKPGVMCSFCAPDLCVDEPLDLLVSAVDFEWGDGGEVTNITLVSPDVYLPQPSTKKSKAKKVSNSPWDAIKKAVRG